MIRFECNYCPLTFAQLKELFDHWESDHKNKCKLYILENKKLQQVASGIAPSAQEACYRFNWYIGDCFVRQEELDEVKAEQLKIANELESIIADGSQCLEGKVNGVGCLINELRSYNAKSADKQNNT